MSYSPSWNIAECPSGSVGMGNPNYRYGAGKGVFMRARPIYQRTDSTRSTRYPETVSIDGCKAKCDEYGSRCRSFQFLTYPYYRRCTLYYTTGPYTTNYYRRNVRSCRKLPPSASTASAVVSVSTAVEVYRCPLGTSQVGSAGQYGKPASGILQEITDDLQNIDECEKRCCDEDGCLAFIFDDNPDICILLTSESQAIERNYGPNDSLGNSVLCTLDNDGGECEDEGECPAGSEQIGETGQEYRGQLVGSFSYKTVSECAEQCKCNDDCFTFTFDDNVSGRSVCKLYQLGYMSSSRYPSSSSYAQEITCAMEVCPDGSSQIGGVGTGLSSSGLITGTMGVGGVESCMAKCQATNGCVAFTFDYDIRTYVNRDSDGGSNARDVSDNGCWIFRTAIPSSLGHHAYSRDGISCGLDAAGSSAQSEYYNFEAITNEAGQGSSDMSVYIIYAVMALILVNIICLIINCWNKKRGNSKRYKVVSMRSDEEITDA